MPEMNEGNQDVQENEYPVENIEASKSAPSTGPVHRALPDLLHRAAERRLRGEARRQKYMEKHGAVPDIVLARFRFHTWTNPTFAAFREVADPASGSIEELRAIVSGDDIHVWKDPNLLHAAFAQQKGVDGVRLRLRRRLVQVNQETVAFPDHFPWVFNDVEAAWQMAIEERHLVVSRWLRQSRALLLLYPSGFEIAWYI